MSSTDPRVDALAPHLALRARIDLRTPPPAVAIVLDGVHANLDPVADAHVRFAREVDGPAHPEPGRTDRYLDALARVLALPGLDRDALTDLQSTVLGRPALLRTGDAFARQGAHRYPWGPDLGALLDDALRRIHDPAVHPVVRASMAYLDVIFLHPFDDGNARLARLVMHHTLHRAGLYPPRFEGVLLVQKHPGDDESFWRLVRVVGGSSASVARSRAHGLLPR